MSEIPSHVNGVPHHNSAGVYIFQAEGTNRVKIGHVERTAHYWQESYHAHVAGRNLPFRLLGTAH